MLDPEFDPYNELMICRHNTDELIRGFNHYSELLKDLSQQHQQLVLTIKSQQQKINRLEQELHSLKSLDKS